MSLTTPAQALQTNISIMTPSGITALLKGFNPSVFNVGELTSIESCLKAREAFLQKRDTELRAAVKSLRTAQMAIRWRRNARAAEKARLEHQQELKAQKDAELLNSWVNHVNKGGPRVRPGGDGYLPILEKAKQAQEAVSDTEGPFIDKDLVPGALLTTKTAQPWPLSNIQPPLITVADRMLVGGPGSWAIVGSDLVTTYNLAGKSPAKVLEVLNKNYWKATRPGQFVSAMSVNVRRP